MARKFNTAYAAEVFKGILNRLTWNKVMEDVDSRLSDVEELKPSIVSAIENVTQVGVDRINQVLTPAIASILEITAKGFLIAHSNTQTSLAPTDIIRFVVPPGSERALFTPSPFCTVSREANYTDYAFVRTIGYSAEHGEYDCQVLAVSSAFGSKNDWVISAGTGVSKAVERMLNAAELAKTDAQTAATSASGSATSANSNRIQTAADRVQTGLDRAAAAQSATLAATFDPTTYQRTTFNIARFSQVDLNLTNGQTVFNIPTGYTPGSVRVYVNGTRINASEFTATNATSVTLGSGVDSGDVVEIETFYVNGVLNVAPLNHTHSISDFNISAAIQSKTWVTTSEQSAFEMIDPFFQIDFWVGGSMNIQDVDYTVSGKIATFSPPIPAGVTVTARAVAVPLSIPTSYTKAEIDLKFAALEQSRSDNAANHEFYGRYYGGA